MTMRIIEKMLIQDAVYWPPIGNDANGQLQFGEPVAIRVRWEEVAKEFIGRDGTRKVSKARVYTSVDTEPDGMLFLGTMDQVNDIYNPDNSGAEQIAQSEKLPTIKGDQYLRTAYF